MAIGLELFQNVVGNNSMNINQWFATMAQENGFSTLCGKCHTEKITTTIYDAGLERWWPCLVSIQEDAKL